MSNWPIQVAPLSANDSSANILLVEDDQEISRMLVDTLSENGLSATAASSATQIDRLIGDHGIDLILLDVMLPGEDGFTVCRRLRMISSVPIIMLTALGQDVNRIRGLDIGADDYVTKPFNSEELLARIRAVLRRACLKGTPITARARALRFAGWRVDPTERQLYSPNGVRITTTSAEMDLLLAFCRNSGCVLSRDQLLELTYGGLAGPIERSIDVHVSRIRQKIEHDPRDPMFIKTVRLGGYIFTPAVEALS
jgi:two-component system OmpR family response regulator